MDRPCVVRPVAAGREGRLRVIGPCCGPARPELSDVELEAARERERSRLLTELRDDLDDVDDDGADDPDELGWD